MRGIDMTDIEQAAPGEFLLYETEDVAIGA